MLFKAYLPPGSEAEGYCHSCKHFSTWRIVPTSAEQAEAFIALLERHISALKALLLRSAE